MQESEQALTEKWTNQRGVPQEPRFITITYHLILLRLKYIMVRPIIFAILHLLWMFNHMFGKECRCIRVTMTYA